MAKFQLQIEEKNRVTPVRQELNTTPLLTEADLARKLAGANRRDKYGSIGDQLDMLWHDINEGRIQADTANTNTWYNHIKTSKENYPMPAVNNSIKLASTSVVANPPPEGAKEFLYGLSPNTSSV